VIALLSLLYQQVITKCDAGKSVNDG